MKKINWIVRIKNKAFWVALIPAILLLVQAIAAVFGFVIDLGDLGDKLLTVVNALFAVLAILGVVVDPTTPGTGDSERALTYKQIHESLETGSLLLCDIAQGGENMSEQNEFGRVSVEELEKAFEAEEQEEEQEEK